MVAQAIDYRRHVRRPVGFVVFGVMLLALAAFLAYDSARRLSGNTVVDAAYSYTVTQEVDKSVTYFPSSFYDAGPEKNTAYIMDLTDKLNATLHYKFVGSKAIQLSYVYEVKAVVNGVFSTDGNEENTANVWSKEYQLVAPKIGTVNSDQLTLDPKVEVPYSQYKLAIEQLRTSLVLPIASSMTVNFAVIVNGMVDGKPFNDSRTASVSAPIGQQIFVLGQKYDKEDTKQVVTAEAQQVIDRVSQYEAYGAFFAGLLAVLAIIYGLRRQIFKTPYQRELDKIYRYHDGIIVRASKPADLTGKRLVAVRSFDDILNLEEELKLPIVATSLGAEATRFMIIRDDVVYAYTLGKAPVAAGGRSLEEIAEVVKGHEALRRPIVRKKIQ